MATDIKVGTAASAPTKRRQVVGKNPRASAQKGTPVKSAKSPKVPTASMTRGIQEAQDAHAKTLTREVHIVCRSSEFQLRAPRELQGGGFVSEWSLKFGDRGFKAGTDEEIEAVEKILNGEWTDGSVGSAHFQSLGRKNGLGIVTYGLELAPIPNWEGIADQHRVAFAKGAGFLDTQDQIAAAIRYEHESDQRNPPREPALVTIAHLEAELGMLQAHAPAQVAEAGSAPLADVDGDVPLVAGSVELGS